MTEQETMMGIEDLHPVYRRFLQEKYARASANYQKQLVSLLRRMPQPDELTRDWILGFLSRSSNRGRPLSNDSFIQYLARIELVARWLHRPELVAGINKPHEKRLTSEDIPDMAEIRQLMQHARDSQARCLIHLMAETGVRIDEALSIQIENITCENTKVIDALGQKATISGRIWKLWIGRSKTATRHVWAYHSTPSLLAWLLDHPLKTGPLFIGGREYGQWRALTYSGAYSLITAAYIAAGYRDERVIKSLKAALTRDPRDQEFERLLAGELTKPPIPARRIHVFRHAAATQMVREQVHPRIMCKALGWTEGSAAPNIYIHLTEQDVEDEMLRRFGLNKTEEKKIPGIESWRCPVCGTMNPPTSGICMNCPPKPMDEQVRALQERIDELEASQLERNREIAEMVRGLIVEMKEKKAK